MKIEHLKKFVGRPVIVQLREAMALGSAAGNGRLVPQCNEQGDILCKDGSIAGKDTTEDEHSMRPAWPIKVQRDDKNTPEFRFAIEDAVIALDKAREPKQRTVYDDEVEPAVHIMYRSATSILELTVSPDQITGITVVQTGPIEESKSPILRPS